MIRRKSEGNKEKSVCPTLSRKRKNPKSWRIWKEKGREGRAGVILSAPRHTRGNRADRGETEVDCTGVGRAPPALPGPDPPAAGQGGRRAWPPSRSGSSPSDLLRAGSREAQPGVGPGQPPEQPWCPGRSSVSGSGLWV